MRNVFEFYKKVDQAYKTDERLRTLADAEKPFINYGWGIIAAGQIIEHMKYAGHFIFPALVRYHLSNIADASTAAAMLNKAQMGISVAFNRKAVSRPLVCAAFALAVNTGWEMIEARFPHRHFDWGDETCHVLSASAYAAFAKRRQLKSEAVFAVSSNSQISSPQRENSSSAISTGPIV